MITISATAIFWFIALGLILGITFGEIIKKEGITIKANVMWGILGSVASGITAIKFGFGDGLLFAFAYTLAILFLVNAFHLHHEEDLFGHVDRGIRIKEE